MRLTAGLRTNSGRALIVPAVVAAALLGGEACADEADAINFIVGQTIAFDDNLFRLSDSVDTNSVLGSSRRSDTIYTTIGGITFDKLVSRQRLHADVLLSLNRYSNYSILDNDGQRANAYWGWQLGNHFSGVLSYERTRRLIDFGSLTAEDRGQVRDMNTYDRLYVSGDWWFHPNYSIGAGYSHATSSYDSDLRKANEYDADAIEVNAKYQPKTGNLIGLSIRQTKGRYPNREVAEAPASGATAIDNSFDQTDSEVNGDWRLTGQSRVLGRLGYTTRRHEQVSQRDFSGVTGRLSYKWAQEGKTSVDLTLRREIGAVDDIDASYVLTDGISVNPVWQPTAKTSLSAKYDWSKRRYEGDPFRQASVGSFDRSIRKDTVNTASISGTYLPLRNLQLTLSFQHERRTSSRQFVDYRDNLASFAAQLSF